MEPSAPSIAIVGLGPRGLSVLERILARASEFSSPPTVLLIDPAQPGPGVHAVDQPDYLVMNTVAGQVTMFRHSDPQFDAGIAGPSLSEWAGVPEDAYLPRRVCGEYLAECYRRLLAEAQDRIRVVEYRSRVSSITAASADTLRVGLEGHRTDLVVDYAVLATGHGRNRPTAAERDAAEFAERNRDRNPRLRYIRNCYPISQLDVIEPRTMVGVQGMGLAAIDVVAQLTEGRGGRFVADEQKRLRYEPSGAEPAIAVFSRHARTFWPRAVNQKSPRDAHRPTALTVERLAALRAEHGALDFARHVVPLLLEEVRGAAEECEPRADISVLTGLLSAPGVAEHPPLSDLERRLVSFLEEDADRAAAGNLTHPFKAATDAIRDLRIQLQDAVEHGSLTPESHAEFIDLYAPLLHVVSAGPPVNRAREWCALIAAGVLRIAAGPGAVAEPDESEAVFRVHSEGSRTSCDVLVGARVEPFLPAQDASALVASLLDGGLARPWENHGYHPGGFDIDRSGRLRRSDGSPQANLFAIGNPTEGPHYFTNMLPAPHRPSRITRDAEHVVAAIIEREAASAASRDASRVAEMS